MEEKKHCKWYNDEFCTNGDSPCVADYCPVVEYPELCKYCENDTETTVGMIRRAPQITPEREPYVRFTKPNAHKTIFTFSGSVEDFKIYKQLQKLEDDLDSGALNYVTRERIPIDKDRNFIDYAVYPTDQVLTKTEYRDYIIKEIIKIIEDSKASMDSYLINKIIKRFHINFSAEPVKVDTQNTDTCSINLAQNIQKLRKQRGWSQEEFGIKVGVSRVTVMHWETSHREPVTSNLVAISNVLSVPVTDLLFSQF